MSENTNLVEEVVDSLVEELSSTPTEDTPTASYPSIPSFTLNKDANSLQLDPERYKTKAHTQASMFRDAINSGTMLVKSATTGETKTIPIEPSVIKRNISLSGFEVRDARIQPKHNSR